MNIHLSNQLNMVGTCLRVAQSREYSSVWLGQEPRDFSADLNALEIGYKIALGKAALADTSKGGASDARTQAETVLENTAHVLARALVIHFKKTSDRARRVSVDLTHTQIVQLRENELVAKASDIRNLGQVMLAEPNASARGITLARVEALTRAIETFKEMQSQPRGRTLTRSALLRELETDAAALVEQLYDLDDLVLQFDGSAAGLRFIAAWEKARVLIDRVSAHPFNALAN